MSALDRAVANAIAEENREPRGLPPETITAMAADIRADRERFPEINRLLDQIEAER